jgi:hypothetical protein
MTFGPRQFVGLAAIVVFGGILAFNLTRPKPETFKVPGAVPLADVPVTSPLPGQMTVHIAEDPLTVGSDAAKDDLYCSGILFTGHKATGDIASPQARSRRNAVIVLAEAGVARLIAEGAATPEATAAIADAQANRAEADTRAGTPRLSPADCNARAAALIAPAPGPAPK